MNKRQDIVEEWQNIVKSEIALPDNQPFLVPEGYFDTLTLRLIKRLLVEQQTIPKGYFEDFPKRVAAIFINGNNEEQVPEGYFDKLPNTILDKIKQTTNELQEIAPVLASVSKTMPYALPEGYFEKEISIKQPLQKPKAVVVPMYKKIQRYAVAASILCILSVSAYVLLKPKDLPNKGEVVVKNDAVTPNVPLVVTDTITLATDKEIAGMDLEKAFEQVDEKELLAFVDNHASTANFAETLSDNKQILEEANIDNVSIEDVIDGSSEAEISEYLSGGSL